MGTLPHVLHGSARAISVAEFYDALQAVCPPRFPLSRGKRMREVALAISGGVDSMALAYLCVQTKRHFPYMKVSDNPVSQFYGIIIDHKLREGSGQEADLVRKVLANKLKLRAETQALKWKDVLGNDISNPADVPNLESLARRLRYRRIGLSMCYRRVGSLFLAHHEDDQYETVLMRLMLGHGHRGLRGIATANDIPECQDMHGVYQSGFVDDQMRRDPFYNMMPSRYSKKAIRHQLMNEIDRAMLAQEFSAGSRANLDWAYVDVELEDRSGRRAPPLRPMPIEDGGINIYRPLLQFPKERLIATCVQNGIPWFEDHTNADPTLTTRNAIRSMVKNYTLPVALQKPAILALADRSKKRIALEEAEADRWFPRMMVRDFEPNVGTAVIQMPKFPLPGVPRSYLKSEARREKRKEHYRTIAKVLIRRVLTMVSPERQITIPNHLDIVSLLCPSLAKSKASDTPTAQDPPKAFTACGVFFIPLSGAYPVRWYICRAPYPDKVSPAKELPSIEYPPRAFSKRWSFHVKAWTMSDWLPWAVFDGRWWVRARTRLPCFIHIAPFQQEHYKTFREALGGREARKDLERRLRRYAPGKVRWTIPAIYASEDIMPLITKGEYWPESLKFESKLDAPHGYLKEVCHRRHMWEIDPKRERKTVLLALPTLGVQLPGLEDWVQTEFRYKKVDGDMLQMSLNIEAWEALLWRRRRTDIGYPRRARTATTVRTLSRMPRHRGKKWLRKHKPANLQRAPLAEAAGYSSQGSTSL